MSGQQNRASTPLTRAAIILVALSVLALAGCGKRVVYAPAYQSKSLAQSGARASQPARNNPKTKPYTVLGKTYHPLSTSSGYSETGVASWYGEDFHGKLTANGEVYNMYGVSAAHKTLPLGSKVQVTNLENGRSVQLVVNDRGPFVDNRLIDLSYGAARALGTVDKGLAKVRVASVGQPVGRRVAASSDGPYFIQVGAFSKAPNAKELHLKLVRAGYEGSRITPIKSNGRTLLGVQAGSFSSLPTAKQALARLRDQFPSCYIASR